jgi:hypothetical protein
MVIKGKMDVESFIKLFYKHTTETPTYEEAYELTETLHKQHFGQRRYRNYDSFRQVRKRKQYQ